MQEAPCEGCLQRSRPRATAAGAQLPLGKGLPWPLGALRCPALAAHSQGLLTAETKGYFQVLRRNENVPGET